MSNMSIADQVGSIHSGGTNSQPEDLGDLTFAEATTGFYAKPPQQRPTDELMAAASEAKFGRR